MYMGACAFTHQQGTSNKQHVANRHSERELEPQEEPLPECQISKELKGAIEASEKAVRIRQRLSVRTYNMLLVKPKGDYLEGCDRAAARATDC